MHEIKSAGIILIIFTYLASILSCSGSFKHFPDQKARVGVLDLRDWNFDKNPSIELQGKWDFYWNVFVRPSGMISNSIPITGYIQVPEAWNNQLVGKIKLPSTGYGTYRLSILVPETNRSYGLQLEEINSAYELWVNGKLTTYGGMISSDPAFCRKDYIPRIIYFNTEKQNVDILLLVCNYEDWTGGICRKIFFGTQQAIAKQNETNRAIDLLLFGVLFITGFYHLAFYLLRRKDRFHIFFAVFCFLFSLKTLFEGTKFWFFLFPGFNMDIYLKLWFMNYYFLAPVFLAFLYTFYPEEIPGLMVRIFLAIAGIFSLIVLIFPQSVYVYSLNIYHLVTVASILISIIGIIIALYRKRKFVLLLMAGGIFLLIGAVNDILFGLKLINTGFLSQIFLIGFIFSESIVISIRSAKAFEEIEIMTRDLENIVGNRTIELRYEKAKLEHQNQIMLEELNIARRIQIQMIPKSCPLPNIAGFYKPMNRVGGDFYDFIKFHNNKKIGIFLSDVSGHGVPAAFITSMIKSAILQTDNIKDDPSEFMRHLNEFLMDNTAGNFVTAFYGIFDPDRNSLVYCIAGHNSPYILTRENLSFLNSEKRGIPLGVLDEKSLQKYQKTYRNESILLEKGTKLIFYTDGLTEAANINDPDHDFEHSKLKDVLKYIMPQTPKRFIKLLYKALVEFKGSDNFDDDICFICLEI